MLKFKFNVMLNNYKILLHHTCTYVLLFTYLQRESSNSDGQQINLTPTK